MNCYADLEACEFCGLLTVMGGVIYTDHVMDINHSNVFKLF